MLTLESRFQISLFILFFLLAQPSQAEEAPSPSPTPVPPTKIVEPVKPAPETPPPATTVSVPTDPAVPTTPAQKSSERWAGKKSAISVGLSPVFNHKFTSTDRFNSGSLTAFDLGFYMDANGIIGARYGTGTIPTLLTYNSTTFITTPSVNVGYTLIQIYAGVHVPINEPYQSTGPIQFFVPVSFATSILSVSSTPSSFLGIGFDAAAGLGARLYTHSFFRLDVSALYHLGIPLGEFVSSSTTSKIIAQSGESMKVSLTGFEFRIGAAFLFPDAPEGDSK